MRFMVCFYRRGRTVTYSVVSGSQRRAPSSVPRRIRVNRCDPYTRALALLTRLDGLHFPDERILAAIRQ